MPDLARAQRGRPSERDTRPGRELQRRDHAGGEGGVISGLDRRGLFTASGASTWPSAGVLFEGEADALGDHLRQLADRPGPIVRLQALTPARLAAGEDYNLADLVEECAIATNTAAAGGNASLMTIG